jgi:hypothetical protein
MEIGLGELNLNPDEFYEYFFEELLIKIEGVRKAKLEQWDHTRSLAFVIAKSFGATKAKNVEDFWPTNDTKKSTKAKGKSVRSMTPEERAEWQVAMKEHLTRMANPNNN